MPIGCGVSYAVSILATGWTQDQHIICVQIFFSEQWKEGFWVDSSAVLLGHLIHWPPKITNLVMSLPSTNSEGSFIYYLETLWGPAHLNWWYANKHEKESITAIQEAWAAATLLRTHVIPPSGMGRVYPTAWGLLWIENRRGHRVPVSRGQQSVNTAEARFTTAPRFPPRCFYSFTQQIL